MLSSTLAFMFFAFISVPALLVSLPFHLQVKNAGTTLIICWTSLGNMVEAISAIIMLNANGVKAIAWCDFAGAIKYTWGTGCCMGGLILLRRLAIIASKQTAFKERKDKVKVFTIEIVIGVAIPLLEILLHFIVQGHRMDELQDFGSFALRFLTIRRNEFYQMLRNEDTGISHSHYLRLMALGLIDILLWLPLSLTFLILNLSNITIQSYQSWSHVHTNFDRVVFVPIETFIHGNRNVYVAAELGRWIGPTLALNFFIFFGVKPEVWVSCWSYLVEYKNILCRKKNEITAYDNSNAGELGDAEEKVTRIVKLQLGPERIMRISSNSLASSSRNGPQDIDIEKAENLDIYAK
ncbi:a-factor receptor [Malassezia brasiliensis]|uniref:A-factor receptor n=1 Tax=Malassezia brasiliensis TaxID=1821822 RepID=A0AAF0DUC2_9BASI|nr:a-factor receptor [Malassezia brasiliensis]